MTIPGLRLIYGFVTPSAQEMLVQAVIALDQSIKTRSLERVAPQISQQHNLATKEVYRRIILEDLGRVLHAQHFDRYGEDGHQLTYFIGNSNIPSFIKTSLIPRIEALEEVQALKPKSDSLLNWKLTLNTYRPSSVNTRSGFDWHVDIPSNGDITTIYTLLSAGNMQMRPCKNRSNESSHTLLPGSCLVLSGPARWEWEHRVLSQEIRDVTHEGVQRISLVLGCRWVNF